MKMWKNNQRQNFPNSQHGHDDAIDKSIIF